ncbi:hypothetical protein HJC10_29340 [Corallococcus exiguus]|uniref:hypothetical protein n=1 Tax=Corallococcus TaxID=83461 RepID=UPI000EC10CAD|nr:MULTISPECIES: hypothetical protein [Corallococcus]NNB98065.1 hypothetical protein [Corallococcus exiguus]NNC06942.1 hypothetical protein [Corallococcus exiguus]NPC50748.1 hypothetical protein [Corallococcus exiguus]RKH84439.1 hypothetical protein D7X99_09035 [Corallococcus sp. AB032C]
MHHLKSVVSLCAVVAVTACGGGAEGQGEFSTRESALVTGTSQGCTFTVSSAPRQPGPFPYIFDITLTREASSTCPWSAGSVVVGFSNGTPSTVSLAANDLGVAVSYTYRTGGPSPQQLGIKHVAPETLAITRSTGLYFNALGKFIYAGDLSIEPDGMTLTVSGTKNAPIVGETGSGDNYVATFPDFFTSETAPSIVAF